MKITFFLLLVTNAVIARQSDSTRFSHSVMYSNYLSISLSAPHELTYQVGLKVKQRHQFNVRTGVYYYLFRPYKPEQGTIRERSYWVFPLYLGYQLSGGQRNQHRLKLDLGSKVISYEPTKNYSKKTFFSNSKSFSGDVVRNNLLLFLQLGYEYKLQCKFLIGGMFNGYVADQNYYAAGQQNFNLFIHPSARIYIGYEF